MTPIDLDKLFARARRYREWKNNGSPQTKTLYAFVLGDLEALVAHVREGQSTGNYRCGCPVVPSDTVKAFCPDHHAVIVRDS